MLQKKENKKENEAYPVPTYTVQKYQKNTYLFWVRGGIWYQKDTYPKTRRTKKTRTLKKTYQKDTYLKKRRT